MVTSRGGPWWLTRASPCHTTGRFEPFPLRWCVANQPTLLPFRGVGLAWPHPVGALLCSPQFTHRLLFSGAVPQCVSLPGLPRYRSFARFAAACLSLLLRAGRGGGPMIYPSPATPRTPAPVCLPECGLVPGFAHRGLVAVFSPASIPCPSGAAVIVGRRGRALAVRGVAGGKPPRGGRA